MICSTDSTRHSSGSTRHTTGRADSPATPRISSAPRSRPCSGRFRSPCDATAPPTSTSVFSAVSERGRAAATGHRITASAGPARRRPARARVINLREWVPDHLERWALHGRGADLRRRDGRRRIPVCRAQPALLGQIVDNLLENACKYSEPGTSIIVRAWRENGTVAVGVQDRGAVWTPEELPRLFEPFFRAICSTRRSTRGRPGAGGGPADRRVVGRDAQMLRAGDGDGCLFVLRLPETTACTQRHKDSNGLA